MRTGLVPFDDLPRMFNPPRDYVATANNKVIEGDEPFFSVDFDLGYRAARIEQMIEDSAGYTVDSAQAMQRDNRDGGAANLVPYLLDVASDDPGVIVIQDLLRSVVRGRGSLPVRRRLGGGRCLSGNLDASPRAHLPR